MVRATGSVPWREWALGRRAEDRLPTPWTELDGREIEFWARMAYLCFYYRPWYVAKAIARFRSWDEVARSVRSAARMLANATLNEDD